MWPGAPERRMARRALAAGLLTALVALLPACSQAPAGVPSAAAPQAPDPAIHELGRKVYNFRCYFCHGYSGDARTLATTYLSPKPRDFRNTPPEALPRDRMLAAVRDGRSATAMKGFAGILSTREIEAVTDFVRQEFMHARAENTRYHTVENGWPEHERNQVAFPFARGDIALDTPWEQLDPAQQQGKRLFMRACVSCHDHGRVNNAGAVWESRPVTYPRDAYCVSCHQETPASEPLKASHPQRPATHTFSRPDGSVPVRGPEQLDARVAAAYLVHDQRPVLRQPSALESRGEQLFQKNCAFCHAADGTSKGWIGSFLEPHPRDLTSAREMQGMTRERMAQSILDGLPGTSMPAWKHVLAPGDIDALIAYISRAFLPVPGANRS